MKTIHVVGAIIKKEEKILIAQRLKGEFAGLWEFPGGKVEIGESDEQALMREIDEELEIQINEIEYLTTAEYDYDTFHLSMKCYLCKMKNDHIQLHDHSAIKWISIDTPLNNIAWVPADIQVYECIQTKFIL